jgi:hypothetical protein
MASRGQPLTVAYVAWNTVANAGATGDAMNHTLRWIKDGTPAALSHAPEEIDATNAPGVYKVILTGGECTCDLGVLVGKSGTSGVVLLPVIISFEQLPVAPAGTIGGLPTVDASNYVRGLQTAVTLTSAERGQVADAVLGRSVANVESTAAAHSLTTVVLAMLESSVDGSTWTIRRTDGTTTHASKTVTRDPFAEPITGVE